MRPSRRFSLVVLLLTTTLATGWFLAIPVSRAATFAIPCGDVPALITAINTANSNNQPDTIELAAGCTYSLATVDNTFGGSANGLPVIIVDSSSTNSLTINGNGATIERAAGSPPFRFLYFREARNARLTLNRVAFENNQATFDGGAVVARNSELTLNRALFENNRALTAGSAEGGALYTVNATTTITDSIFRNNRSERSGGAITFRTDGFVDPATVTGTTFSGNQTTGEGGAIAAYHDVTVSNSTFSGNQAGDNGGALFSDMGAQLEHVTMTGTQTGGNGALYGTATLRIQPDRECRQL
jgi:autotransporter family porin